MKTKRSVDDDWMDSSESLYDDAELEAIENMSNKAEFRRQRALNRHLRRNLARLAEKRWINSQLDDWVDDSFDVSSSRRIQ